MPVEICCCAALIWRPAVTSARLKLSLWVAGMLHVRPSERMHVADESEDDDEEEEQEAGDGMFSETAVCSKPWLVCLK